MEPRPIQVLVVDDSALMRNLVSRIIDHEPDLTVAGKAMNGRFALNKIDTLKPDVIVLDLEMPEMNGVEFLKERKQLGIEIPIIVLSAVAKKGASITMEALALGAVDFIPKPTGQDPEEIRTIGHQLVEMLRSYGSRYRRDTSRAPIGTKKITPEVSNQGGLNKKSPALQAGTSSSQILEITRTPSRTRIRKNQPGNLEIIAIGISTGGPNALREVFSKLDPSIKTPILVVQHMPPGFTTEFAKSLDRICPMDVKEAQEGDIIRPGRILIAPGDYHISVERKSLAVILHLHSDPPVNGHRPSADVLFESVAKVYGNKALGIIMTGMGKDGADKLGEIYEAGGITIGQDQVSSVVYGMPRVAYEYGYVMEQVNLDSMADKIASIVREYSG